MLSFMAWETTLRIACVISKLVEVGPVQKCALLHKSDKDLQKTGGNQKAMFIEE